MATTTERKSKGGHAALLLSDNENGGEVTLKKTLKKIYELKVETNMIQKFIIAPLAFLRYGES